MFMMLYKKWWDDPSRTSCCSVTTVTEAITCTAFVLLCRNHLKENGPVTCVYNNSTQSEVYTCCLSSLSDLVTFLPKRKEVIILHVIYPLLTWNCFMCTVYICIWLHFCIHLCVYIYGYVCSYMNYCFAKFIQHLV